MHGDSGPVTAPASAYSDRPGHAHDSTPKPEASTACPLQVYVAAPFYGSELFQANLLLPCDPADATRQVARQLRQLALPFAGVVVEACPQPCASCLVFVVLPEWLSFAGGSAVVLDMHSTVRDDRGPLLAAFLSRPTDCSEIRREAGAFAIGACDVYIGNSASPLDEHEYVTVPSGTTIRLSRVGPPRTGYLPLSHHVCRRSPVLVGPVPRIPQPKVLLLLHHSGKFLFSGSASPEVPLRDAIARFVGANHEEVTFHTPRDNGFAGATYRGVFIRDVLAILERREPIEGRTILFLDLRQVGASFQFLCLEEPKISYDALEAVLPRPPPLGWRLAVSGGRRYRHHLSVQHCDIVILGFVHQADGPADFYSLSSSSEAPPSDEDGEEENDTDDASVGSTRSPNRPLLPAGGGASPSSDKSYKGGLPGDACDGFASASAVVPSYSALPLDPLLFADPLPGMLCTFGTLSGPLWGHLCVKPAPSSWPCELSEHSPSAHLWGCDADSPSLWLDTCFPVTKTLRLPTVCRVPDDAPPARPAVSSVRAHGRPGHDLPQPEEGFPWLPLLGPPEAPPRDGLPAPDECLTTAPSIVSSCSGSLARSTMYWVSLRPLAIQSAVGGSHMFSLFAHNLRVLTARCLLFLIGCKGGLPG